MQRRGRRGRRWAIGAAIVGVAVATAVTIHVRGPWRERDLVPAAAVHVPAGSAPRALLGGLAEGQRLVGWTVEAIEGPDDTGEIRVFVGRDGVRFALMVAPKGASSTRAPVETDRYGIYFGHVDPAETELPANTITATTNALARRVRANEADVSLP